MGTKSIRTGIACLAVILVATIFCVGDVLAWNWGVHAYVDDNLGTKKIFRNLNEMYGAMAPDLFNYIFDQPNLYLMTHNGFMQVWNAAQCPFTKAAAFGFVSHNDMWGADSTAHHACTACNEQKGYVVAKADLMLDPTNPANLPPMLHGLLLSLPFEVAEEISHNFVEAAVDILLKQDDPAIGKKLTSAALLRSPTFPLLLVRAYADNLVAGGMTYPGATNLITLAESEFRKSMVLYGYALMQDDAIAVHLIAEQMASIAEAFLAAKGVTLPPLPSGLTLAQLIEVGVWAAHGFCADDYKAEIDETIRSVHKELKVHGIGY
jgi:hypothetical protein